MIDIGILITGGIGIVTTVASGFTSWFFTRKKYNSEVDNNVIQNMKESLDFYKQLSDDNKGRLEEILKRNDRLEERNDALEKEIRDLRNKMFDLMSSICIDMTCQLRKRDFQLFENSKYNKDEDSSTKVI